MDASPDDSLRVIAQIATPQPPEKVSAASDVKPGSGAFTWNELLRNVLHCVPDVRFADLIDLRHEFARSDEKIPAAQAYAIHMRQALEHRPVHMRQALEH